MRAFAVGCVLVAAPTLQAGIYSAAEPSGMRAGPDGRLVELPYVPAFKSFLEERFNAANPATLDQVNGINTFRGLLKQRVAAPPAGRLSGRSKSPGPSISSASVAPRTPSTCSKPGPATATRTSSPSSHWPTPTPRKATGAKRSAVTASPCSTPNRRRNCPGCCPS